jgi:ATP-binding cassette subfamily C (CFTR/MRP) protein 1
MAEARRQDMRSALLTTKEERQQGEVDHSVYRYYVRAGGSGVFVVMVLFIVLSQACQILSSFWLSYWGDTSVHHEEDGQTLSTSRNVWFLNVFAALSCLGLICYMICSIALADHRMGASVDLHRGILHSTLSAPVSFFDVTPTGRILNRFSSDLLIVDEEISQSLSQALNSIASVLSAVGAIAGATKGTFLILLLPIVAFYRGVQKFFKATNTSLARLESISRSPIYADFSQALNGMTTIRAYKTEPMFVAGLERRVDANTVANVTQQLAGQWLAIRLDLIGALISFFMAVLAASAPGFIPPGFVALGLTYSFQLTTYLKYLFRMLAQLEAQLNSVERVKYYMDNIEHEGKGSEDASVAVPEDWPTEGTVVCRDVEMRYRDGPLVLKGHNFDVAGAQKIGVAGRTGSGKSSLMIALFRVEELVSGSILIDNVDISKIPLSLLRSKLGIIPQDPVMFSASVRFNLDPFEKHSDAEIWQVELSSVSLSIPGF